MHAHWQRELSPNALVLAAVSGGADSVFLARHLHDAFHKTGHQLVIAHVNHGLRGVESDEDERFVEELAKRLGVSFFSQKIDPNTLLNKEGKSGHLPDENSLRRARLGILRALATAVEAEAIALGHHQDDLAESFLLMALRGSGPIGLAAMPEVRTLSNDLKLIRPLLHFTRDEIRTRLEKLGESWREDHTNQDLRYRRNRVRAEVIPVLESVDGSAIRSLAESAHLSGEMADWYRRTCDLAGEEAVLAQAPGALLFKMKPLRQNVEHALHAGVIRHWWLDAAAFQLSGGDMPLPPGRDTLTNMIERLREETGSTSHFENESQCKAVFTNHFGIIHSAMLTFEEALRVIGCGYGFPIVLNERFSDRIADFDTGETIDLACGSLMVESLKVHLCKPSDFLRRSENFALIDPGATVGPLKLRIPEAEERVLVAPDMHKSFRRCLQEAGVPDYVAGRVPALTDEEGIVWIPGIRRAARAWINDGSSDALRLEWLANQPGSRDGFQG